METRGQLSLVWEPTSKADQQLHQGHLGVTTTCIAYAIAGSTRTI